MTTKPIVVGMALGAALFAALMPPESYPVGKMGIILCATFPFLIALLDGRISRRYAIAGLVAFPTLAAHSLLFSVDLYRSLEFLTVLWAYYALFGFFTTLGSKAVPAIAVTLVGLSIIVSGYGLYQYIWGFDQMREYLESTATTSRTMPAMDRIATGRVFSTLALPGTLWGILLMTLPLHAILYGRNRLVDVVLFISAGMLLATGFLTRSFGFLLSLFVLIAAWLVIRHRSVLWNRLLLIAPVLVVAGGLFYFARSETISSANPISLRFLNWVSAWNIFAENGFGTGLNTFGLVYPAYMLPGADETQHVHNTALQFMSELGYLAVFGAVALLLIARTRKPTSPYLLLAAIVWGVHNLIDINVYFASIGVIGIIVLGALFGKDETERAQPGRGAIAGIAAMSIAVVIFSAFTVVAAELEHRAQVEYELRGPAVALATLQQAQSIMPLNSNPAHNAGEILLDAYYKTREPERLEEATESFRRAIALSPVRVDSHMWLSLCFGAANDVDAALAEIAVAESLYPENTYVRNITRLLEERKAGLR